MRKFLWQKVTAALSCPQGFLLHPGGEDDDDRGDDDDHDDDDHGIGDCSTVVYKSFLIHNGGGDDDGDDDQYDGDDDHDHKRRLQHCHVPGASCSTLVVLKMMIVTLKSMVCQKVCFFANIARTPPPPWPIFVGGETHIFSSFKIIIVMLTST